MPLMSAELYDALLEAGASEETARKAAEAVVQITEMRTSVRSWAVIKTLVEQLQHRMTLVMTLVFIVLGGVLSTLWVLARH